MADLATAGILKEILDELKKLNQKLDLNREEVRGKADVKNENQHDEAIETRLEAGGAEASQVVMSGGLDNAEHVGVTGGDISRNVSIDPAKATSPALAGRTFVNEVSLLEDTKEQAGEEITFRYRWNGPSYGNTDPNKYPEIPQSTQDRWSKLLPSWGIPHDQRILLTLNTSYLVSLPDDEADKVLKTVQDCCVDLENKGSLYSRFTIKDYFPDGRIWSYFDEHARGWQSNRPDEKIRIRFDSSKYPPLDETKAPLAPWRRFIEIRGLACIVPKKYETYNSFPWLGFRENVEFSWFLKDHLECSASAVSAVTLHLNFQITFYEIVGPTNRDLTKTTWQAGPLHSDQRRYWPKFSKQDFVRQDHGICKPIHEKYKTAVRYLRESALSMIGILAMSELSPNFWTIIMLTPEMWISWDEGKSQDPATSLYTEDTQDGTLDDTALSLFVVMVRLVEKSLAQLYERHLQALFKYFQELVSEKSALFDPNLHDSLLFDNETFSRSKTYFWAINMLREIEVSISRNITEVATCIEIWPRKEFSSKATEEVKTDHIKGKLAPCIEKLSAMKSQFKTLREEAQALRDGLFSASAVMESRASTRLGENVKLLTFVSIFFLPLSFCMSLWSINNTLFSLSALSITATIVALATYIVVFNINNISRGLTKLYNFGSSALVAQIENEHINKDWSDRAEGFKKAEFMSRDEHVVPSKWRLVQYAIIRPKAAVLAVWTALQPRSKQKLANKEEVGISEPSGADKTRTRTGIFKRWWFRSKKTAFEVETP